MTRSMNRRTFLHSSMATGAAVTLACGPASALGIGGPRMRTGREHLIWSVQGVGYRVNPGAGSVQRLSHSGLPAPSVSGLGASVVAAPADGGVLVVDRDAGHLLRVSDGGAVRELAGTDLFRPRDAAVDVDGVAWVVDSGLHQVTGYAPDGRVRARFGKGPGIGETSLNGPRGIAVDPAGRLHVLDAGNARVVIFERDGAGSRVGTYGRWGDCSGALLNPRSIVIDRAGSAWIADAVHGSVQVWDSAGNHRQTLTIRELGGAPMSLSLDPAGDVYVRIA